MCTEPRVFYARGAAGGCHDSDTSRLADWVKKFVPGTTDPPDFPAGSRPEEGRRSFVKLMAGGIASIALGGVRPVLPGGDNHGGSLVLEDGSALLLREHERLLH